MPHFEAEIRLTRAVEEVFEFFVRPTNLVQLTPPELNLQLTEAPERLNMGARIVLRTLRWGIPQQVAAVVTVFEPPTRLIEEQVEGPFRKWSHCQEFEAAQGGTRVRDRIEFEPPGGALGLLLTARFIERELEGLFAFRQQKLKELFAG